LGGWLSDKWGRLRVLFMALILIGPVAFLLTRVPFGVFLVISFILYGLLMTMRETTMQTYLMDKSPSHLRATVYGLYFGFAQEGSSIIQPVAGDFMDVFGIGKVYGIIAYIVLGLSVLTLIIAIRNSRRRHPETNHRDYG
jgi:MFS family permease